MNPIFRTGKWKCSVRVFRRCATAQACGPMEFSAQNGIQAANLALAALAWEVLVLTICFCRWWSRTGQVCNKLWGKLVKQIVRVWFAGDLSCERLGGICVAWWLSFASFVRLWCKCILVAFSFFGSRIILRGRRSCHWPGSGARCQVVLLPSLDTFHFAGLIWHSVVSCQVTKANSCLTHQHLRPCPFRQWLGINGCWPWTVVFALFRKWLAANFLCHAIRNCDHSSAGFEW